MLPQKFSLRAFHVILLIFQLTLVLLAYLEISKVLLMLLFFDFEHEPDLLLAHERSFVDGIPDPESFHGDGGALNAPARAAVVSYLAPVNR